MIQSQYHPYCPIQWGNTTSEQDCWLGDLNVTLPDVNTQDSAVVSAYSTWISSLVSEFNIDGLRIDGMLLSSRLLGPFTDESWLFSRKVWCNFHMTLLSCLNSQVLNYARHVNINFWPVFCGAAGVFCIGEVFDDDIE